MRLLVTFALHRGHAAMLRPLRPPPARSGSWKSLWESTAGDSDRRLQTLAAAPPVREGVEDGQRFASGSDSVAREDRPVPDVDQRLDAGVVPGLVEDDRRPEERLRHQHERSGEIGRLANASEPRGR